MMIPLKSMPGEIRIYIGFDPVERVLPDDRSALRHEEESWLTLITCQGFDEASGEYFWRMVVRAALVEVNPGN